MSYVYGRELTEYELESIESDLMESMGLYIDSSPDYMNRFKRFNSLDLPSQIDEGCKEYIFITKPDLNIYTDSYGYKLNTELNSKTFYTDLHERNPELLRQLQLGLNSSKSPFINILTNRLANTLDLPNSESETIETSANVFGTKLSHRGNSYKSDEAHTFSLEFQEDNKLSIYNIFKAWDMYEDLKSDGIVSPPDRDNYIEDKIYHDKVAIYKFITRSDHMTIIFAAKLHGVFPKNSPRGSFSEFTGGKVIHSIEFHADFVEDNEPIIFVEFNELVDDFRSGTKLPLYDKANMRVNGTYAKMPYIEKDSNNNYLLKWEG